MNAVPEVTQILTHLKYQPDKSLPVKFTLIKEGVRGAASECTAEWAIRTPPTLPSQTADMLQRSN